MGVGGGGGGSRRAALWVAISLCQLAGGASGGAPRGGLQAGDEKTSSSNEPPHNCLAAPAPLQGRLEEIGVPRALWTGQGACAPNRTARSARYTSSCRGVKPVRFVPSGGCRLEAFDARQFVDLLGGSRGRVVWMVGDSMIGQLADAIGCLLAEYNLGLHMMSKVLEGRSPSPPRELLVSTGHFMTIHRKTTCTRYGHGQAYFYVCFMKLRGHKGREGQVVHPLAFLPAKLPPTDVIFASFGAHFNNLAELEGAVNGVLKKAWAGLVRGASTRPAVLWLESSAQHFDTPTGAFSEEVNLIRRGGARCRVNHTREELDAGNWRNSVTSAAMAALGVPVLPVWLPSALASGMHVVDLRIKSWEVLDCTHFCEFNGGLHDVGAELLYNWLLSHPLPAPPAAPAGDTEGPSPAIRSGGELAPGGGRKGRRRRGRRRGGVSGEGGLPAPPAQQSPAR